MIFGIHKHTRKQTYAYSLHTHTHALIVHTHTHKRIHTYSHTHTHTNPHTYTHTHTPTPTHTRTHTHTPQPPHIPHPHIHTHTHWPFSSGIFFLFFSRRNVESKNLQKSTKSNDKWTNSWIWGTKKYISIHMLLTQDSEPYNSRARLHVKEKENNGVV
jgi:hypothetical protein